MKTLHLNLKRKWFDMIQSGEKKEEYREVKRHWINQLASDNGFDFKKFDTVTFSNGFAKDRDQFVIDLLEIRYDKGRENWGAESGVIYFVLSLGDIIKTLNQSTQTRKSKI